MTWDSKQFLNCASRQSRRWTEGEKGCRSKDINQISKLKWWQFSTLEISLKRILSPQGPPDGGGFCVGFQPSHWKIDQIQEHPENKGQSFWVGSSRFTSDSHLLFRKPQQPHDAVILQLLPVLAWNTEQASWLTREIPWKRPSDLHLQKSEGSLSASSWLFGNRCYVICNQQMWNTNAWPVHLQSGPWITQCGKK